MSNESARVSLPEHAKALLDAPEFATVATINPDGAPQLSVVWVERDGDEVLFTVQAQRRKAQNLMRDPRVSVLVYPLNDPYSYLEVRGHAVLEPEEGQQLLDRLAVKYTGKPYPADPPGTQRLTVRIIPHKVHWFSE